MDMRKAGIASLILELRFPRAYPARPPFARIVWPRLLPFARGGGASVTKSGVLCMKFLTKAGWDPKVRLEAVFWLIRESLCKRAPAPERLECVDRCSSGFGRVYTFEEARESYLRMGDSYPACCVGGPVRLLGGGA